MRLERHIGLAQFHSQCSETHVANHSPDHPKAKNKKKANIPS